MVEVRRGTLDAARAAKPPGEASEQIWGFGKSGRWPRGGRGPVLNIACYDEAAVRESLDYPGCIAAMREAMMAFSADAREQPLRQIIELAPGQLFATMPGTLAGTGQFGAKLVTVFSDLEHSGRSRHAGLAILFEGSTGKVEVIADADTVTEIRTACATAAATDSLARSDAETLALFGCGVQAASHLRALAKVRPLKRVVVWGRSAERIKGFADSMADETGLRIEATLDGRSAAAEADIICTVSSASEPILLGEWVRPGTHINLVGSSYAGPCEVDNDLVTGSRYFVDSRRSVEAAGAEYLVAKEAGLIGPSHILGEIGDVMAGLVEGRRDEGDITVYKSLGHIAQDLAALAYLRCAGGAPPR